MKKFLIIALSIVAVVYSSNAANPSTPVLSYEICFTPPGHCGDLIVSNINNAKHSVFVQAYGFTSKKIINALVQAKNRGIQVEIILDRSNFHKKEYNILKLLQDNQIQVYQDKVAGISHNKVMIIDNHTVITGSFNFTENADKRNAENVVVITNDDIANSYYKNWLLRR